MFQLHPSLQKKDFICDLDFCRVLLEDNKDFPWIFLVPKKNNIQSMRDLTHQEHLTLMTEIEYAEKIMATLFSPTQTNIAMIGNMTPQLHVHIICRYKNDPYWPDTVWNKKSFPYSSIEKQKIIDTIKSALMKG